MLAVGRDGTKPLDPVKVVHVKGTHTGSGPDLVWRPEPALGTVYLRAMTDAERVNAFAIRLLDQIRAARQEGLTKRDLERTLPSKGRDKARGQIHQALAELVQSERVVTEIPKDKKGPKAPVYRAAEFSPRAEGPK